MSIPKKPIMNKKTNYFFLSGFFLVAFLVVQFTGIYGNPGWFKAFLLILSATFLISGLGTKTKE
jgi:uncharacterized membrane protein YhdT